MPTIISHIAVPLAIGLGLGKRRISEHLLCAGVVASVIPDADVIGFKFGIEYASQFGHRGFTHSICFALLLGLLSVLAHRKLDCTRLSAFLFVSLCAASHALLDALTDGGLGVALFWPYDNSRFFFPGRESKFPRLAAAFSRCAVCRYWHRNSDGSGVPQLCWVAACIF